MGKQIFTVVGDFVAGLRQRCGIDPQFVRHWESIPYEKPSASHL
jgi:hypothetical protein